MHEVAEPAPKTTYETAQSHHDTLTPEQQANARKKADAKVKNDTKGTNSKTDVAQKYIDTANDPKTSPSEKNKNILAYEQLTGEAFPDSNGKKISDTNTSTGLNLSRTEEPAAQEKPVSDKNETEQASDDLANLRDKMFSVDLNESEIIQEAQNVKDSATARSFIQSMFERFFGKDTNNPKVQDAMNEAIESANSSQWWNSSDESIFTKWYDNTKQTLIQLKNSISKSLSRLTSSSKNNNAATGILDGFTSVDLNDL